MWLKFVSEKLRCVIHNAFLDCGRYRLTYIYMAVVGIPRLAMNDAAESTVKNVHPLKKGSAHLLL